MKKKHPKSCPPAILIPHIRDPKTGVVQPSEDSVRQAKAYTKENQL